MFAASRFGATPAVLIGFVALHVLQNLWRPILTSRVYETIDEVQGATILSIESQSQRLGMIILAPLFGWMVDTSGGAVWPLGLFGGAVALTVLVWRRSDA